MGFGRYILRKMKVSKEIPRRWKKTSMKRKNELDLHAEYLNVLVGKPQDNEIGVFKKKVDTNSARFLLSAN